MTAVVAMVAAVVPVATATAVVPVATPAQAQSGTDECTDVSPAPVDTFALPGWADGTGWSNPWMYSTIMNGDVTGDGIAELLANNGSELEVYSWAPNYAGSADLDPPTAPNRAYDPNPGQWVPLQGTAEAPQFATTDGWWDMSRASTFQLGDVLGLGYDQVVVRGSDGVTVYRWDAATTGFGSADSVSPPIAGPPWSDAEGWGQENPERYETIMTGDVDGDLRDEIVGYGPAGMEVWGWDGTGIVREDAAPSPFAGDQYLDPSSYQTFRLGHLYGQASEQLVVRDPADGIRVFGWADVGQGLGFVEGPTPGSNDWTDANGWNASGTFETISVGDVDGDGTDDLVARSPSGIDTWTYDYDGGRWVRISRQPTLDDPTPLADTAGYSDPSNWGTFQLGDVLPDPGPSPTMELLVKADEGMATYRLADGAWGPATDANGNALLATYFADSAGWDDSVATGTPPAPQWRSSTIRATTVVEGEPQVLRGRSAIGIAMVRPDGSATTADFPTWTDLTGIPNTLPPTVPAPGDPLTTQEVDLAALSPEGRAYWHVNAVAMSQIWPGSPTDETILDRFQDGDDVTSLSNLYGDLSTAIQLQQSGVVGNDSTTDTFNPGNTDLKALNVPRSTFVAVEQDVADWTNAVTIVNDYFLGSQGQEELVVQAYLSTLGQVQTVEQAFEPGSQRWKALLGDLAWGIIGGLTGLNEFIGPTEKVSERAVKYIKAGVTFSANVSGAATSGAVGYAKDPKAELDTEASQFEADLRQQFCSMRLTIGENYAQIVTDYGLLVATEELIDRTPVDGDTFQYMVDYQANQFSVWIWQQFANRPDQDKNWWVGWCNGSSGCPWKADGPNVYVSPENPEITYRLAGQKDSGKKIDCGHDVVGSSTNIAFRDLDTDMAAWASPRETPGMNTPGHPLPDDGRLGVNGWNLGVDKCN